MVAACAGKPDRVAGPAAPPAPASQAPWDRTVKVGNPYQVSGNWYFPEDDPHYDETGVASWYGPGFDGKSTANGEVYDMNGISAAHRTLPLPSYVEVTNLENSRRMVVRVNDRGPFVGDRVIDLSRRTAELLGLERQGTGRVRVRRVHPSREEVAALQPHASRKPILIAPPAGALVLAADRVVAPAGASQPAKVAVEPLAVASVEPDRVRSVPVPASLTRVPGPTTGSAPVKASAAASPATVTTAAGDTVRGQPAPAVPSAPQAGTDAPALQPSGIFVQVAAVSDQGRAAWLAGYLQSFGATRVERGAAGLYRVRLGPYPTRDAALLTLARVRAAGYEEAWVLGAPPPVG